MSDFQNTIDLLGDDVAAVSVIERSICEYDDDSIKSIGGYAFRGCDQLTGVNLSKATKIGLYAFYDCSALINVNLPSVTRINAYAFGRCPKLTRANIPLAIDIGNNAFFLKINRLFPIKFVILSAKVHKGIFIALVKEENKTKNKKTNGSNWKN